MNGHDELSSSPQSHQLKHTLWLIFDFISLTLLFIYWKYLLPLTQGCHCANTQLLSAYLIQYSRYGSTHSSSGPFFCIKKKKMAYIITSGMSPRFMHEKQKVTRRFPSVSVQLHDIFTHPLESSQCSRFSRCGKLNPKLPHHKLVSSTYSFPQIIIHGEMMPSLLMLRSPRLPLALFNRRMSEYLVCAILPTITSGGTLESKHKTDVISFP